MKRDMSLENRSLYLVYPSQHAIFFSPGARSLILYYIFTSDYIVGQPPAILRADLLFPFLTTVFRYCLALPARAHLLESIMKFPVPQEEEDIVLVYSEVNSSPAPDQSLFALN